MMLAAEDAVCGVVVKMNCWPFELRSVTDWPLGPSSPTMMSSGVVGVVVPLEGVLLLLPLAPGVLPSTGMTTDAAEDIDEER